MGSLKKEAAQFKPVDLVKLRSESNVTDAMRMACGLYNSALSEIENGSVSSARGNLRKATALCPEFNYAVILYGICTFYTGDRTGAMRIFNSVKTPSERSRAMKIYDRLVDEELSVSAKEVSGARLRKAIESFTDNHVDSVYRKHTERQYEEETIVQPRSLFFDSEPGMGDSGVKIAASGWSGRAASENASDMDGPREPSRRKTVVTLHQLPEIEEQKAPRRKLKFNGYILTIIVILLLIALLIAVIGWVSESAKRRTLERDDKNNMTSMALICAEKTGNDEKPEKSVDSGKSRWYNADCALENARTFSSAGRATDS